MGAASPLPNKCRNIIIIIMYLQKAYDREYGLKNVINFSMKFLK